MKVEVEQKMQFKNMYYETSLKDFCKRLAILLVSLHCKLD